MSRNGPTIKPVGYTRTVVATGSFNNEGKRDSEENLNVALVLVTDTSEKRLALPQPTESSPKTLMHVQSTLYAE